MAEGEIRPFMRAGPLRREDSVTVPHQHEMAPGHEDGENGPAVQRLDQLALVALDPFDVRVQRPRELLDQLPLDGGPGWMRALARANPLTYVVDAERALFAGDLLAAPVLWGFVAAGLTAAAGLAVGIRSMRRSG